MRWFFPIILMSLCPVLPAQGWTDFANDGYLSFEQDLSPASAGRHSKLNLSEAHCKTGTRSLQWTWNRDGATLRLDTPVPYRSQNPDPRETSVSTFIFWLYSPERLDGALDFSFQKKGKTCSRFTYGLGFTGWRGAWVAFDRDMEGRPEEGMDAVTITVRGLRKGTLFLDGIIPSAFEDVRYHTADFQAPFINPDTNVHWLLLNKHWNKRLDLPEKRSLTPVDRESIERIRLRFIGLVTENKKAAGIEALRAGFAEYGIHRNPDGTINGKPIFFTRYGETFLNLGIRDASRQFFEAGQLLRPCNDFLLKLANAWLKTEATGHRKEIEQMYVLMTRHLLDQGFAAGSGMGTLHHLGYSMKNFYTAPVIMKEVLRKAGLLEEVQQAMEWFSGAGEVKHAPQTDGMDIDAFNTYLLGRLAALLMLDDTPYKYAYLQALTRWTDNGFRHTSGTKPCFKRDGTVVHHRKAYPAYAVGGFDGAVKAVWLLSGTPFSISEAGHGNLKNALLEMRFYCNLRSFPLAMSGRHPDGLGALIPEQYARLADAGTPDGRDTLDRELAAAYLRLAQGGEHWCRKFRSAGIEAECAPAGTRAYGYNCSLSARGDDWLVTVAGHSRYLWATETYERANLYGRYLTHGSMQILGDGDPVSAFGSGYQVDGWDWCHIPGTTAAVIPLEKMRADVLNVDNDSGYEEMLLSDEWFAGGMTHLRDPETDRGRYGTYALLLHEHDKYNGSLRARKSFFLFGNRIVCLGSGLENALPGSELHTTLFQNATDKHHPSILNGKAFSGFPETAESRIGRTTVRDRFGNAWIVQDACVRLERTRQHSLHEETGGSTEGNFEKAYLHHWTTGSDGTSLDSYGNGYEYLALIHPSDSAVETYSKALPYRVLSRTDSLHAVVDLPSGAVGAAIFNTSCLDTTVLQATPCLLMYTRNEEGLTLSISNPDLALYAGPADELFKDGKRVERSVYSRKWVDADCGQTRVEVTLSGHWYIAAGESGATVIHENGNTRLRFTTREARTEEIVLRYEHQE